jgi:hypothetical protein
LVAEGCDLAGQLEHLQQFHERNPNDSQWARFRLALIHLQLHNADAALVHLQVRRARDSR